MEKDIPGSTNQKKARLAILTLGFRTRKMIRDKDYQALYNNKSSVLRRQPSWTYEHLTTEHRHPWGKQQQTEKKNLKTLYYSSRPEHHSLSNWQVQQLKIIRTQLTQQHHQSTGPNGQLWTVTPSNSWYTLLIQKWGSQSPSHIPAMNS